MLYPLTTQIIEVPEISGLDPGGRYEFVDLLLLAPNDSSYLVSRKLTIIDQLVNRSKGNAEPLCGLFSTQPL